MKKTLLYARNVTDGTYYLRNCNLNPNHFIIVVTSHKLTTYLQGTTKTRILILNDHPINLSDWAYIKAVKATTELVYS